MKLSLFSKMQDRIVISLGEFNGGPDEEFPEEKTATPIDFFAVIVAWCLAILVVGVWL